MLWNLSELTITELNSINEWADFWRFDIGVNVIPADTKRKVTYESWAEWQGKPIPDELYSEWRSSGVFDKGIAVILGKVWHNPLKKELYLIGIDLDNQKAIEEVAIKGLEDLAKHVIVEQHKDDATKAHVLLYSHKPFPKKSSDKTNIDAANKIRTNEIPAIEVKGLGSHGILFVSPSIHQNGQPYQIIGIKEPDIVDDFVQHIDNICKKYAIPYLDVGNGNGLVPIQDLFKPDFTIFEGHNRHEALMRTMESLIARNSSILSLEEIKPLAQQWNLKHCSPPLDDKEFEKQWECATDYIAKKAKENRKVESDIMTEFLNLRPQLLGYIFDTLVKALQIKSTVKLNDLPRMADSALWSEAIARAMGYKDLEFIQAYYQNIGKQNIEAIENHPLGQAVAKFYEEDIHGESKASWEGQPANLLEHLEIVAQRHRINTNHKLWPKEVRWLTRRLNQIRSNLVEGLGINVTTHRDTIANTSTIKVCKMTPVIPMTPESQNRAQNKDEKAGDISKSGENDSGSEQMTPEKIDQNHAQNMETGETGESMFGSDIRAIIPQLALSGGYDDSIIM